MHRPPHWQKRVACHITQVKRRWPGSALSDSLIDPIWDDRPHSDAEPAYALPDSQTGKTAAHKLEELQETLAHQGLDGLIITAVDCVNWLFNLRGKDLANTPFHLCFAFVPQQGRPTLIEGDYMPTSVSGHPFVNRCQLVIIV